jgi:hypothetical protein
MQVNRWFLFSGISGWAAAILLLTGAALPYVLRPTRLAALLGFGSKPRKPYLARFSPHTWIGYGATVLAYLHGSAAMHIKGAAKVGPGLSAAMIAESLLIFQVLLGLILLQPTLASRKNVRRTHFWIMIAIVVTISGHIAMMG